VSSLSLKSNVGGSVYQSKASLGNSRQDLYDGPTIPYKITIRTGDERNCGTNSQVFIRLIGYKSKQDTGRILLQLPPNRRGFAPGSAEIFQIEAMDIGDLRQIEVKRFF
jgi:hypothetical protein